MKNTSPININPAEIVNAQGDTLLDEVRRIEGDPEKMLALVDLIFGFEESHLPPS